MKVVQGIDVSDMARFNPDQRAPLWWGILGLITIESAVVLTFCVSYMYLAAYAEAWPPSGESAPPMLWPSINLGLLMLSSLTMFLAGQAINRGNQRGLAIGVTASVLLASTVLVLRSLELMAYEFSWKDHAYGSIVWTISGFHYVHVTSIVFGSAVVAILAWRGYFTQQRQIGVVVDTNYWYFVCFAWIPFYLLLYWGPRVYGQ
ncbi:cytochrome c oxidase subunit 3 [Billgrantia bachuensis]|uniref:cytochrome-c oxidase n=1 Tax=Billgrantia bachuensis TaxID=2717286 RepID=A0ABX0PR69_9GAMM|nr:cytochrome c oxidase subunit 3 [Halomonas bachuensis]NIC05700.1 heme-copper oxidase subunit III [Halomonas bachuensis]